MSQILPGAATTGRKLQRRPVSRAFRLFKHRRGSWGACLKIAALLGFVGIAMMGRPQPAIGQGQQSPGLPESYCAVCHSDTQVEFHDSSHSREGLTCVDCHGGDPKSPTVQGAHSAGFRRTFTGAQVVELCSSCHSDPARMKPYGLPIDQHALYLTSVHGRKFLQGDRNVAVCTDCHGAHKVLSPSNPKSPVFRQNIPNTCARCHENASLMKAYNVSPNIVGEYRESVHGKALLQQHSARAPDCTSCHGTHGAAPPGAGNVATLCGQCHTKTRDAFRNSAHAATMAANGKDECSSCHGNHRIERAGHQLWSTSCTACHDADSPQAERGRKIQALLTQAEGEIDKARASVEEARRVPFDVGDYEARLADSVTYLVEARPVSHDLAVEDVEELARRSRSIALEVQSDIHEKVSVFRGRVFVLIAVWFYILVTVGVVVRYRRRLEGRQNKGAPG
jgi:predicted CXXCH cytochrome family protein